jgi:hypothetical protein
MKFENKGELMMKNEGIDPDYHIDTVDIINDKGDW